VSALGDDFWAKKGWWNPTLSWLFGFCP